MHGSRGGSLLMRLLSLLLLALFGGAAGFAVRGGPAAFARRQAAPSALAMAAESEVSFGDLDGRNVRIGIIRTRWNEEHVSRLVAATRQALRDCQVQDSNVFETTVPGSFELPLAARFLALSGTVDAVVCAGVLIKGDTMHFEYIADAVAKGVMNVGLQTNIPVVFGVLTCLDEAQVRARSADGNNHGYDWGKTAVEMALLRAEAMGEKAAGGTEPLAAVGFAAKKDAAEKKASPGFF